MRKLLRNPEGELSLRVVAPEERGQSGTTVYVDWLTSLMELAAGSTGSARARTRVITAAVSDLKVLQPAKAGDIICVHTDITRVGSTSITLGVRTYALRNYSQERLQLASANITVVPVDDDGLPRPLAAAA
jgi:acyl-CoA thioesterase YciA